MIDSKNFILLKLYHDHLFNSVIKNLIVDEKSNTYEFYFRKAFYEIIFLQKQ